MVTIPVITERCAGIDVGKRGLAVAVAVGPADKEAEIRTRWFGTTAPALRDLHARLRTEGCTTVAMESTGSYWIPVKNILSRTSGLRWFVRANNSRRKETKPISATRLISPFITGTDC
jgi:transposase